MRSLNPEKIAEMKKMREGGASYSQIAKAFKVTSTTVNYWLNDNYREKTKARNRVNALRLFKEGKLWGQQHPDKYKKWFRDYQRDKYWKDKEHREKVIKANVERSKRLREEGKEWRKKHPIKFKRWQKKYRKDKARREKHGHNKKVQGEGVKETEGSGTP
jgi:DNA-binding CsgD family transcriptional regulator